MLKQYCEWSDSELCGSDYQRNPHNKIAMNKAYLKRNGMKYCPCCGKKIKFVGKKRSSD